MTEIQPPLDPENFHPDDQEWMQSFSDRAFHQLPMDQGPVSLQIQYEMMVDSRQRVLQGFKDRHDGVDLPTVVTINEAGQDLPGLEGNTDLPPDIRAELHIANAEETVDADERLMEEWRRLQASNTAPSEVTDQKDIVRLPSGKSQTARNLMRLISEAAQADPGMFEARSELNIGFDSLKKVSENYRQRTDKPGNSDE